MVLSNYKCMHIRIQDPEILIQGLQVHSSNVSSNRIKIQEILLILQLETDYFSKLFISEMHSKQWHYSLHRDFQNCYSTRRSLTRFFSYSSNSSSNYNSNSTRVPIHHAAFTSTRVHTTLHIHPENSPSRNPILHAEDKELFEYYTTRNSTHRRQGDLLEMHPCVLQDLPVTFQAFSHKSLQRQLQLLQLLQRPVFPDIPVFPVFPDTPVAPDTPETFRTFQSFMTFQPFQAILQILHCSSISRDSTPFQHSPLECIFYNSSTVRLVSTETPPSTS